MTVPPQLVRWYDAHLPDSRLPTPSGLPYFTLHDLRAALACVPQVCGLPRAEHAGRPLDHRRLTQLVSNMHTHAHTQHTPKHAHTASPAQPLPARKARTA